MKSKTIINLIESTGLTKTFKKIFNYFSIFTIVLGSTFGTMNSAYALSFATLDAGDGSNDGAATTVITTGAPIIFDETGALTITVANGAETTTSVGALTRTAGNPTVKVVTLAADTDNQAIAIASINFAVAGEGDIEFTAENNSADDGDLTVTVGDLSTLGKVELEEVDIMVISLASPIGQALQEKTESESLIFNGIKWEIFKIL